jgi:hypothetical protein
MTTTTDTALQTGTGQFGFALLIEGFPYVITDSDSMSAVTTAYAATSWSSAIGGLKVVGSIKQSISPFKGDLDVPTLTFQVFDYDGNDTFGTTVFKTKPTIQTRLSAVFQPGTDGSGTVTVKDNTNFAASGTGYLGTRTFAWSSKSGGTGLVVSAAGANKYSPFTADTGLHYSLPTNVSEGQNWDIAAPPRVSNVPATWIGKKVALYIHRILSGVWDVSAQAHLEFAGTIAEIQDGDGFTVVTCHDLRRRIEQATLNDRQWVGYVRPGIYLRAGDRLRAREFPSASAVVSSAEFTVVSSGASGTAQANAGYYDYTKFLDLLSEWLDADATLTSDLCIYTKVTEQGTRTRIRARFGTTAQRSISLETNSQSIFEFMGFQNWQTDDDDTAVDWISVHSPTKYDNEYFINSEGPPYRIKALQRPKWDLARRTFQSGTIDFDSNDGTWFNHSSYLPKDIQGISSGTNWSYVLIGGKQLAAATYVSATELNYVVPIAGYGQIYASEDEFTPLGVTFDDPIDQRLEVKQVIYLTGKFSTLVPKLIASLGGTSGVNHATHDAFPWGAGIPWSLLGDTFTTSCESLETENTDDICIRMDKPTRLKDVLVPELALRFAFLVFKDGVYQFVSPPTPSSLTADHTMNETNKAGDPGEAIPPTSCKITSDFMHNVVKVQYERTVSEKFARTLSVRDTVSISLHGETEPITIDAVNSVAEAQSLTGSSVERLAANLSTRVFPMFGRPVKLITRSIAPSLFHAAPGDTVSFSDDLVRDPTTGVRGISSRACIVLETTHDYGHEGGKLYGEVTLLMGDEDRTYPLSPACEIDTTYTSGLYTNGYDSTNFRLKILANSFSKSTTDSQDVTNFVANDLIRIVELDPANPSSIDAWSRTIASVDTGTPYIQLTASISSPSWSGSTKKFVIIPQAYTSVQTSQKTKCFQADDADARILDTIEPNTYGTQKKLSYTASVATELPALLADETYGDGKPLTPFQLYYLVRMANNLASYKTAPHAPFAQLLNAAGTALFATTATSYTLMGILPFFVGGISTTGRTRNISIAPQGKISAAGTAYFKFVASARPPVGRSLTDFTYVGTNREVEFTTTSTTTTTLTAQDLPTVNGSIPGWTWLSIQMKTGGANEARLAGIPILYLKPME